MFDEWTDERGVAVLRVVAQCRKLKFCIDVKFLEGKGPNNGVEHTEVASAMIAALATVSIHPDQVRFCISDNLRRMRFMAQFNGDIEERLV